MNRPKFGGVSPAVYTPFHKDNSVNYEVIEPYFNMLYKNGVRSIFLTGGAGEWSSLNIEERKKILEKWMECKKEDFTIICNITDLCFRNARELAKLNQELGVDGICSMGSMFFSPKNEEVLAYNMSSIAKYAPETPFFYYHIPVRTHVDLKMAKFVKIGLEKIPTLTGIKFSSFDMVDFGDVAAATKDIEEFTLYSGPDRNILQYLTLGSQGCIGATYSTAIPIYIGLWESYSKGNLNAAKEYQELSRKLVNVLAEYTSSISASKFVMKKLGLDLGITRLPIPPVSINDEEKIWNKLKDLELTKYLSIV